MPAFILTTDSQVTCAHGGVGKPMVPIPRVKIMGKPVVGEATPYTISACPFQKPTVPPTPSPCVLALGWQLAAVRVKAMNLEVLLAGSKATCTPNGVPTTVIPVQTRVQGT
jgi:hypothetical protein